MLILRTVGLLIFLAILFCLAMGLIGGQRAYYRWAWRLARYALIVALVFFGLLVVERLLVPFI